MKRRIHPPQINFISRTKMTQGSDQVDYKGIAEVTPDYTYNQVFSTAGTQELPILPGGGQESIFEIDGTNVINLHRTVLSYTALYAASGNAGIYVWTWADAMAHIGRLQIMTIGGLPLSDIRFFPLHTKTTRLANTKLENYLQKAPGGEFGEAWEFMNRSNALANANPDADGSASVVAYTEPRHCIVSGNNTAMTMKVQFSLGDIIHSIAEQDKDILFNQKIRIVINWSPGVQIHWRGDSATDPSSTVAAATTNMAVQNLSLYVATEKNTVIKNQLSNAVLAGAFTMLFETSNHENTSLAGTTKAHATNITTAEGKRLVRVYSIVTANGSSTNQAWDNSVGTGSGADAANPIATIQTYLNNNPQQNFPISLTNNLDWLLLKDRFEGSVVQSKVQYRQNYFWIDDFGVTKPFAERGPKYLNTIQGSEIVTPNGQPATFTHTSKYTTTNGTQIFHKISVVQRVLHIGPGGITVV